MSDQAEFMPLAPYPSYTEDEMQTRAREFFEMMAQRRTVREFSDKPVPREIIEDAIRAAGRAPSGANKQPWHFAVISSQEAKSQLREAAEEEENLFYSQRASEEWLQDLKPFGTDAHKPFLERAPYLIVVFRELYGLDEGGERHSNYYVHESVGIACGFLLTALHNVGLATLTHTPAPMTFLNQLCGRGKNERAMMVIVTGYAKDEVSVPKISKKDLSEITSWI